MKKQLMIGALALAMSGSLAQAEDESFGYNAIPDHEVAAAACMVVNEYQPVEIIEIVEDGMGDYQVWLADTDGDLWSCNANGHGDIFSYVMIEGDLLDGAGIAILEDEGYRRVSMASRVQPQQVANTICSLPFGEQSEIVASVPDGLGDFLVWIEDTEGQLWFCNASAEAEVYIFEPVDYPLVTIEGLREA